LTNYEICDGDPLPVVKAGTYYGLTIFPLTGLLGMNFAYVLSVDSGYTGLFLSKLFTLNWVGFGWLFDAFIPVTLDTYGDDSYSTGRLWGGPPICLT